VKETETGSFPGKEMGGARKKLVGRGEKGGSWVSGKLDPRKKKRRIMKKKIDAQNTTRHKPPQGPNNAPSRLPRGGKGFPCTFKKKGSQTEEKESRKKEIRRGKSETRKKTRKIKKERQSETSRTPKG